MDLNWQAILTISWVLIILKTSPNQYSVNNLYFRLLLWKGLTALVKN